MNRAIGIALAILAAYLVAAFAIVWAKRGKAGFTRALFYNLVILYLLLLFSVTLVTIPGSAPRPANFIPFVNMLVITPSGYVFRAGHFWRYWVAALANLALFSPFGLLFSAALVRRRYGYLLVSLSALLLSCGIECLQLALPIARIFDVDDIIFNTLGAQLGVLFFAALSRRAFFAKFLQRVA